jgi:hypothetical protein
MSDREHFINSGFHEEPKIVVYLNFGKLIDSRPDDSEWPNLESISRRRRSLAEGSEGMQFTTDVRSDTDALLPIMVRSELTCRRTSIVQLRCLLRYAAGNG